MEKFERLYHEQIEENRKLKHDLTIQRQSLRDRFAMAALSGLIAHPGEGYDLSAKNRKYNAEFCYQMADAMLAAREKESGE